MDEQYLQKAYDNAKQQAQTVGRVRGGDVQGAMCGEYRPSPLEEAEKSAAYLSESLLKAEKAKSFFRAHPEFSEFISLIRSGAIGI